MIAILGAGIAGIAAGYHLSQRGIEHTIFEKNSFWGGLCDNFSIGEGFLFDKFVHLSFTKSEVVKELFHKNTAFYSHKPESSNYWLKHPVQNNLAPFVYRRKNKNYRRFCCLLLILKYIELKLSELLLIIEKKNMLI